MMLFLLLTNLGHRIVARVSTGCDISTPETSYKTEGSHAEAWTLAAQGHEIRMGADLFMDGKQFNPEKITDYLEEMEIHNLRVDQQALKDINR